LLLIKTQIGKNTTLQSLEKLQIVLVIRIFTTNLKTEKYSVKIRIE